jgi:O-antigen ligase
MAVVFTQSRGGFLGLAFCVLLGFFHSRNKFRFAGGALLLFILLTPFIHDAYVDRIGGMTQEDFAEKDGSAGSRLVLWRAAILMFKDKPIFGHGFMTFSRAKMDYKSELDGRFSSELLDYAFQPYKVCHGTYFNLLAEGGLFLTMPYLLLIAGFLWKYYRNRARIVNGIEDRESVYLLEGIAVGVLGHCVSILTIDSQMDIFMPIQLVCGGILLRSVLQELAQPQTVTVLKVQEGVA